MDLPAVGHDAGSFEDVAEFANVARPTVGSQKLERIVGQGRPLQGELAREALQKVVGEQLAVLDEITKGG